MRTETRYLCEVCGAEYSDRAEAERCEAGHHEIDGFPALHYQPIAVEPTGYPDTIEALMTDGRIAVYQRTGEVKEVELDGGTKESLRSHPD